MHSFCCTQKLVLLDVDRTGLINLTFVCLTADPFFSKVGAFFYSVGGKSSKVKSVRKQRRKSPKEILKKEYFPSFPV